MQGRVCGAWGHTEFSWNLTLTPCVILSRSVTFEQKVTLAFSFLNFKMGIRMCSHSLPLLPHFHSTNFLFIPHPLAQMPPSWLDRVLPANLEVIELLSHCIYNPLSFYICVFVLINIQSRDRVFLIPYCVLSIWHRAWYLMDAKCMFAKLINK